MSTFFSNQELIVLEEEFRNTSQLLYMSKNDTEGLANSLKSLSLRTGWAIYLWDSTNGLSNLKNNEPPSPKTKDISHAIEYASNRKHFSVFVFPVMNKSVWLDTKLYLSKIKALPSEVVKYLFILPKGDSSQFFEKQGKKVELSFGLDGEYVLRDGRWVNSNAIS
ncbi:hypothetical protein [Marinicella rhabdoformis]|uniref:hypothetical protein n=1 Tax=Marinicella rhabdoformis TaxID=2580566 RepID=UPI0012AECDF8|nr:hypothetical protein [Marinicella rhabdoformis]